MQSRAEAQRAAVDYGGLTVLDVVVGDVDPCGRQAALRPRLVHVHQVFHRAVVRRPSHMQSRVPSAAVHVLWFWRNKTLQEAIGLVRILTEEKIFQMLPVVVSYGVDWAAFTFFGTNIYSNNVSLQNAVVGRKCFNYSRNLH